MPTPLDLGMMDLELELELEFFEVYDLEDVEAEVEAMVKADME